MRWLIILVTAFVIAFSSGCAVNDPLGILEGLGQELNGQQYNENWEAKTEVGWQATDPSGNHWLLYVPTDSGTVRIASCDYSYMKVRGIEKWKGKYYGMTNSLNFHGPVFDNNLENLSGCVAWVESFIYGDHYI